MDNNFLLYMQQGEKTTKEKAYPLWNTIFTQKNYGDRHELEIVPNELELECANYLY